MRGEAFRYIPLESHDAGTQMALDEACMEAVRDGRAPATVRLYRWHPSAVSIGYFQCLEDEVDRAACAHAGVAIVRRQTGGGAVYHDTEGEITYSIVAPERLFPKDIVASSREICSCIVAALDALGIRAEFRPINDVVIAGRKASGNAQTRRAGVLLQHGTILLTVDAKRMFTFLTPDKSKLSDKPFIKSVESAVTGLTEHTSLPRERIEQALTAAFKERFPGSEGDWTAEEIRRAEELVALKYGSDAWNALR